MLVIGALHPSLLPGLTYHAVHSEWLRTLSMSAVTDIAKLMRQHDIGAIPIGENDH